MAESGIIIPEEAVYFAAVENPVRTTTAAPPSLAQLPPLPRALSATELAASGEAAAAAVAQFRDEALAALKAQHDAEVEAIAKRIIESNQLARSGSQ
jgi:hypothetical protein